MVTLGRFWSGTGKPAVGVYEALRAYAGGLPLVSYNTDYDLEQVLKPEWKRLGHVSLER